MVADSEAVQDQTVYHQRRYQLGLGEGTTDMPPGNCTPLESNAVFLNGGKSLRMDEKIHQ